MVAYSIPNQAAGILYTGQHTALGFRGATKGTGTQAVWLKDSVIWLETQRGITRGGTKASPSFFNSSSLLEEWPSQAFSRNIFQALLLQEVVTGWHLIALSGKPFIKWKIPLSIIVLLRLNLESIKLHLCCFLQEVIFILKIHVYWRNFRN